MNPVEDEGFYDHEPESGWCSVCTGTGCSADGMALNAGGLQCPNCNGTGVNQ